MPRGEPLAGRASDRNPPGTFVLSLDFELIWGTLDLFGPTRFGRACEIEREVVIDRLLSLLDAYDVPATWCVLGHLFLESCTARAGVAHPEVVRPHHAWATGDWFRHDPCRDEKSAPLFYARSLVRKILDSRVRHEIGAHSFSHVIYGDPGCSREAAASDLAATVGAARGLGLDLRSFVFPRNAVGHVDLLSDFGFTAYRGAAARWYEKREPPSALQRLARLWSVLVAAPPPLAAVRRVGPGLTDVPASMIYFPRHGVRRFVSVSRRVARAQKGLAAAARSGGIFHLWFHPTNLADDTDGMLAGLEQIFSTVRDLLRQGRLRMSTMGALACEAEDQTLSSGR